MSTGRIGSECNPPIRSLRGLITRQSNKKYLNVFVAATYLTIVNALLQKCGLEPDFKDQYTYLRKFLLTSSEITELRDLARLFLVMAVKIDFKMCCFYVVFSFTRYSVKTQLG